MAGRYTSGPITYRNGVITAVRCPASGSDDRSLVVMGECQVCGLGVSITNVGTISSHHRTRQGQSTEKFERLLRIVQSGRLPFSA